MANWLLLILLLIAAPTLLFLLYLLLRGKKTTTIFCGSADDMISLLSFDRGEREKNNYVLSETIEAMAYVRRRLGVCLEKVKVDYGSQEEQIAGILDYVDWSIKEITILSRLVGAVNAVGESLEEKMQHMCSDCEYNRGIPIVCKVRGGSKDLNSEAYDLILSVTSELLNIVLRYSLSSGVEVRVRHGIKYFQLLLKCDLIKSESSEISKMFDREGGLPYYVLQSVQSRLSFLGGSLHVSLKPADKMDILVQLPIN